MLSWKREDQDGIVSQVSLTEGCSSYNNGSPRPWSMPTDYFLEGSVRIHFRNEFYSQPPGSLQLHITSLIEAGGLHWPLGRWDFSRIGQSSGGVSACWARCSPKSYGVLYFCSSSLISGMRGLRTPIYQFIGGNKHFSSNPSSPSLGPCNFSFIRDRSVPYGFFYLLWMARGVKSQARKKKKKLT